MNDREVNDEDLAGFQYGHWNFHEKFNPDEWFGFIYLIINLEKNKKYIGKKQFRSRSRKKIKNRKNRKLIIKESNWREYTSSSDEVNDDILKLGKEKFKFEILLLCKTKRELGYAEVELQFKNDVLRAKLDNGEREYYNGNIMSRWFAYPTEKIAKKISLTLSGKPKLKKDGYFGNQNARGNKDRPKTKEHREKIRLSCIGKKRPNYTTPLSNFLRGNNRTKKQKLADGKRGLHGVGCIWINNGILCKRIKKNILIPEGWVKGKKLGIPSSP